MTIAHQKPWLRAALMIGMLLAIALTILLTLWLAGVLFVILHRALPHHVDLGLWLTYWRFYHHEPVQHRLLLLSLFLAGVVMLVPGFMLSQLLAGKGPELHGSARFATAGDVRKAGLMGEAGMIVGKHRGRFLQFPGQQFCLLAAPTRSGKGVSFVIPNLLNWPDSVVVLDIKLENFRLTSKYRARHGQEVYLFAPFAEDHRTHRWNPLDAISRDPAFRIGDLLALASSLYPALPDNKDAFWQDTAKNLFLGLALMVMESPELSFTLSEILRQSGGEGRGLKEYLTERTKARRDEGRPFTDDCLAALNRFMSATENTLANIITTFSAPLSLFANPMIDAATSASDFDLAQLRDRKISLYIGIQPNRLGEAALLVNLLFSQLIHLNTKSLPSGDRHRLQCLLIMDEFTSVGKIGVLAKANAFIAGYNLRLLTIIQSLAQLEAVYGQHDARTLVTNHAMQVLFAPREQKDANAYSEMLGYYTVKSTSKGRSNTRGVGGGGSSSENVSDQRRALLMPQELKELPEGEQIIIYENTRPIRCDKARWYEEPAFIDRLKSVSPNLLAIKGLPRKETLDQVAFAAGELAAPVPRLDLQAHRVSLQMRARTAGHEETIDMEALELDPAMVPPLADPLNPSVAQVNTMLDGMFENLGVDPGAIAFQFFGNVGAGDNMMMEA